MKIRIFLPGVLLSLLPLLATGQSGKSWDLSFEFQAYPTGLLPGIRLERGFDDHHALHLRAGYNWVRHRDLGEWDDERGGGFGGTLGYRFYLGEGRQNWFFGARSDLWFNQIDWQDLDDDGNLLAEGTSDIVVLQPTAEAGYLFTFGNDSWLFAPSLGFGLEINVQTEGEEVGQGAILLLGFTLGKRF
ncbi:MAG: hypothetical protein KDC43_17875 [Saprospiraceae bacterium]|nr:hypothetical protein [Saprospiraceae bacterium]MCB0678326.1 hypothetical protein [Saprospiraceae bacterium]MCB0681059.1 hypothetical protein [Saprospiraceae bacterium]